MIKHKPFRHTWLDSFSENGPQCVYQRALGFALHYHMDDQGCCHPGHRRLAKVSGMSVPTVRKNLKAMNDSKWVDIKKATIATRGGYLDSYQATIPDNLSGKADYPLSTTKRETPLPTSNIEAGNTVAHFDDESGKRQNRKREKSDRESG